MIWLLPEEELRNRENWLMGRGVGGEKSYDGEKAWSSIIH
jgi:hypothetical protein